MCLWRWRRRSPPAPLRRSNLWPLAILCPAVLMWLWQDAAPRAAAA